MTAGVDSCAVREATVDDLPQLVAWGRLFAGKLSDESNGALPLPDEESLYMLMARLATRPETVLLVAESDAPLGMIAGTLNPVMWAHQQVIAQELFWWVDETYRGTKAGSALLDAFEAWGKEHGACSVVMVCEEALRPKPLTAVYRRRGYKPQEHGFIKRVA